MICPFTGNGMASALESAALALEPIVDYAEGASSWTDTVESIQSLLARQSRRVALAEHLHPFFFEGWKRRALEFAAAQNLLPFGLLHKALQ